MEELKVRYSDDFVRLNNIVLRKGKLQENSILESYTLMQDSLQEYYRWSFIKCEFKATLRRGEKAEIKELLDNILKYLSEVHTDARVIYKNSKDDLRSNREDM